MTLNGAITQLVLLSEHPMMPVIFRPAIQKVIETISELDAQPEQRTEILYRHYKGGTYELVCNNVTHTETGESLVIYRDCRGQMWARPESMFYGLVKVGDDLVPRFVLCQSEGDAE